MTETVRNTTSHAKCHTDTPGSQVVTRVTGLDCLCRDLMPTVTTAGSGPSKFKRPGQASDTEPGKVCQ